MTETSGGRTAFSPKVEKGLPRLSLSFFLPLNDSTAEEPYNLEQFEPYSFHNNRCKNFPLHKAWLLLFYTPTSNTSESSCRENFERARRTRVKSPESIFFCSVGDAFRFSETGTLLRLLTVLLSIECPSFFSWHLFALCCIVPLFISFLFCFLFCFCFLFVMFF